MSTSGMYVKSLTKKNALTVAAQGMTLGVAASVSGVPAQVRYQEKTATIKFVSSIPYSGGMLLYHLASIF